MYYKNKKTMDLNMQNNLFLSNGTVTKKNNYGDTTLSLDCSGYQGSKTTVYGSAKSNTRTWGFNSNAPDDGCRLVLGLGPTPSIYSGDCYTSRVNRNKDSSAIFSSLDGDYSILKLGLSGGTEEVSSALECTVTYKSVDDTRLVIPVVDEGSTSAKKSGGYMPSLLFAPRSDCHRSQMSSEPSAASDYSIGTTSDYQTGSTKKCKFLGCTKGARGATGLCIGHGGGQRCQKPGCNKGSESRTAYCKAHGGGRRCQQLGCTKSAEGKTDHCIAHGGGRRCGHPTGCSKAARGKSGLCIRHGGGKRCNVEGCTRSAEGQVGLCISHGGGRRCQFQGCKKGAQGSTMYCKAHGGGKRCVFAGCTKGAEGSTPLCKGHGGGKRCLFDGGGICPKSVHGGTNFCVAHGGGKRCAVSGCTKSARGRTDCCVKHGGGKRCVFENCGKSAQGSTDLCKAHGGGKRCNWGEGKCEKFARGKSGLCAAHSTMVQETDKKAMIRPGLFHGLVPTIGNNSLEQTYSSSGLSVLSDTIDSLDKPPAKRRQLIPPQVLVPLSMKYLPASSQMLDEGNGGTRGKSFEFVVPEGRVHNGGLLSLLGGNLNNAINGI